MIIDYFQQLELKQWVLDVKYIDEAIEACQRTLVSQIKTNAEKEYDVKTNDIVIKEIEDLIAEKKEMLKTAEPKRKKQIEWSIEWDENTMYNLKIQSKNNALSMTHNNRFIKYYEEYIEWYKILRNKILDSNK